MKVVAVRFRNFARLPHFNSEEYNYFVPENLDINLGDLVIAQTQYGLNIAEVTTIDGDPARATKFITQKVIV